MTENQDEAEPADLTEARERRLGEERKERTEPWLDPEAAVTYDLVFINFKPKSIILGMARNLHQTKLSLYVV